MIGLSDAEIGTVHYAGLELDGLISTIDDPVRPRNGIALGLAGKYTQNLTDEDNFITLGANLKGFVTISRLLETTLGFRTGISTLQGGDMASGLRFL